MSPTNATSLSPNPADDLLRNTCYFCAVPPWLLAADDWPCLRRRMVHKSGERSVRPQRRASLVPKQLFVWRAVAMRVAYTPSLTVLTLNDGVLESEAVAPLVATPDMGGVRRTAARYSAARDHAEVNACLRRSSAGRMRSKPKGRTVFDSKRVRAAIWSPRPVMTSSPLTQTIDANPEVSHRSDDRQELSAHRSA
jgi:hypothetical protein